MQEFQKMKREMDMQKVTNFNINASLSVIMFIDA